MNKANVNQVVKKSRPLYEIAMDISKDWSNPSVYAIDYIQAMRRLNLITDMFYQDSAKEIVLRFLSNASSWRGDKAKAIKAELKQICGIK